MVDLNMLTNLPIRISRIQDWKEFKIQDWTVEYWRGSEHDLVGGEHDLIGGELDLVGGELDQVESMWGRTRWGRTRHGAKPAATQEMP